MKKYKFYLDRKITSWIRETHEIEADSEVEAIEQMKQGFEDDYCESIDTFIEQEKMYECDEYMEPEDNAGEATAELFNEEMQSITDNSKRISKIF